MQVEKTAAPTAGRQHSASATDAVVVLDHVSKRFGGVVAVDDLSLKVTQGKPLIYSSDDHIIISIPTTPRGQTRPRAPKSKE